MTAVLLAALAVSVVLNLRLRWSWAVLFRAMRTIAMANGPDGEIARTAMKLIGQK